ATSDAAVTGTEEDSKGSATFDGRRRGGSGTSLARHNIERNHSWRSPGGDAVGIARDCRDAIRSSALSNSGRSAEPQTFNKGETEMRKGVKVALYVTAGAVCVGTAG